MKSTISFIFICCTFLISCKEHDKKQQDSQSPNTTQPQAKSDLEQHAANNSSKPNKEDVAFQPDESLSPENKIQFYRDHENYEQALGIVDSMIIQENNNQRLWSIKGILHFENEDTTQAIIAFEKATSLFPVAEDRLNLAMLYAGKGDIKSIQIADSLSKGGKGTLLPKLNFVRGTYYGKIGKKEQAISFFEKAIHDNFTFMDAYREKATLLCELKRYPEAINTLIRAVTLQNNYEEGYYYLGQCYEKIGDVNKAIEAYQTALMYDPDDQDAVDGLSRLTKE